LGLPGIVVIQRDACRVAEANETVVADPGGQQLPDGTQHILSGTEKDETATLGEGWHPVSE